jgi:predicted  nucleic acid-binding Zn-ribbon protein
MKLFSKAETEIENSRSTTLTTQPDDLNDFVAEARARLREVTNQKIELQVLLAQATERMHKACVGQAVPPWDVDREVNSLRQQIRTHEARILEAEVAVRDAEGRVRIATSKAAASRHAELRRRVISALEQLRSAMVVERDFRYSIDFSSSVITAVFIPGVDVETLDDAIASQKGYL